jgi:hypothetical protein
MKNTLTFLLLAQSLVPAAFGQFIEIRVSAKVILQPTTGARPAGITDNVFYTAASNANTWRATYYRGYRYQITEIINIGGPTEGGSTGPSKWYGLDFRSNPQFLAEAQTNSLYRLRSDQVNVYVATGFAAPGNSGGGMPIPPGELTTGGEIFVDDGPWWLVHELGHFFGLSHTFAGENASNCTPGDDGLSDTLPDSNCWTTRDLMATATYGTPYANLAPAQQTLVDNTYYNAMSYHEAVTKNTVENRRTEQQLDLEADIANTYRAAFVSGHTRFVSTGGSDSGGGSSSSPYRTVAKAVSVAASGGSDILLLEPGNYNEQFTLSKPLTLRAPRTGWATIGH